jgi:uncharacterized protein
MSIIATVEELEAIYGHPNDASTVKVADRVTPPYRVLIETSPFAALATSGPEGLDCSPRGDLPGFVRIHDEKTLMMPDRRGNNRIDSLRNIVRDPRVALLFLIPGSGNTLRVNGCAHVSRDAELLASFKVDGKAPRTVIVIRWKRSTSNARERSCAPTYGTQTSGSIRRPCQRRGRFWPR